MSWMKEIDQEYELRLISLRAYRDINYLTDECDDLISKVEDAQTENVAIRKSIRGLEREIYSLCHRNAHNACVIDGLLELDEQAKETRHITSELQHKLDLNVNERHNCEEIISMLRHEIFLLNKKTEMDAGLLELIRPNRQKLKYLLNIEKLETHQKAQEFLRDLLHVLEKYQETNSTFEGLSEEMHQKATKLEEIFASTFNSSKDQDATSVPNAKEDVTNKEDDKKTAANPKKNVSSKLEKGALQNGSSPPGSSSPDSEEWENITKLEADTKILDNENTMISNLIRDFFPRMNERFSEFMDQCALTYEIDNEISLVQEYIKRLHTVRLKKESDEDESDYPNCEYLEEKKIVLNIRECEERLLNNILLQFMSRTKEDFQLYQLFDSKIRELYLETL